MNRYLQESSQYLLPAVVFIPVRTHFGWNDFSFTKRKLGSCVLFESRRTELMKGLRFEAEAKYRHSTWKANKDAEPKRPLMHTCVCVSVCVWVKCEPNGTWRLCTCIKIELKEKCAGTPKTWSLLPKQISYVVNLKLNTSLSMQRYENMTRCDKICRM